MDLNDTPEQAEFRARAREWIAAHAAESPPPATHFHAADPAPYREWQAKLAKAGLVGVTWPAEFGGAGLGPAEQMIANTELAAAGCATIVDHIAIGELGPTIIAYGSDEQKDRYLAPMLEGSAGWCQLFSEPAAGSDLAGIVTKARRGGDGWVIDGQKVWTTMAQFADFGLLLARTDPSLPKHRGLTMFVVDMHAPGVTVRPLRQITGASGFNEVFFDGVELPEDATVGPVDAGWQVAMTTLMFERMAVLAALDQMPFAPEDFVMGVLDHPGLDDGRVKQVLAEITAEVTGLQFTAYRALSALGAGGIPGPEAGLGKIGLIESGVKGAQLLTELLGPDALEGEWGELLCEMQGLRSGGGTDEILRNTIGERVLGLPPEPRVDKGVPFEQLVGGAARNGAEEVVA
ncbi:MAG: acyl-CoA dehydrogenase family protein [Solirubrobacterales bacterium]|nr:acyl-CoA dehydrogenase family protein [Solirubrobacterales bacterium]MCB8970922.1 acyl-CoA dehydrogenase family protein [Thermoleophilales bacterium]MCO5326182.1 acyl-CoA dehydrogenase family protein [Solirubrobacterales bacterium]